MKRSIMFAAALAVSSAALAQDTASKPKTEPVKPMKIGDKAPALDITHWVKGDKVAEFQPGKVYVVEFWATWCGPCRASMPHLSETQAKYKDYGVTLVSISDEELETVTEFLKQEHKELKKPWSEVVQYTLTTDPDRSNHRAYAEAYGAPGIPFAVIVGKDGKVEWAGNPHPKAPDGFDKALDAVVKDEWDRAAFATEFEQKAEKMRAARAKVVADRAKMGRFKELLKGDDSAEAYKLGEELMKNNWEDSMVLNELAWTVVDDPSVKNRNFDFALKAAQQANTIAEGKNAAVLDTLARVHFEMGELDKAIELQTKAVELADEMMKPEIEAALKKYKAAKGG